MRLHSPSMIFLSETKNRERTVKRVQRQLNMEHAITVEPLGLSGGLALFWSEDIQVCQSYSSPFYIAALIQDVLFDCKYWFIFVYLSTDRVTRRYQMHELVKKIHRLGSFMGHSG